MNSDEYGKITKFTDMVVWQEGHSLVLEIYKLTEYFPKEERYGITDQMRRAAVSVTSNIAEGFSRQSVKEKIQFFKISQGSLIELQNQLIISMDVGYLSKSNFLLVSERTVTVHKLMNGLLRATRLKKYEK